MGIPTTKCPCGEPCSPYDFAQPIGGQVASVGDAKTVQKLAKRLFFSQQLIGLDARGRRAAAVLAEAGFVSVDNLGVIRRMRVPDPVCRRCYLRETRAIYASIDPALDEPKKLVGPTGVKTKTSVPARPTPPLTLMVPSLERRRTLGLHVTPKEFRTLFDPVLGDARIVLAQAEPYTSFLILGGVLLPKGVHRDWRAHPPDRSLPTDPALVTLIDASGQGRPTFRVVTKLAFVRAVAALETDAATVFDALVRDGGSRMWPTFGVALPWPLAWMDDEVGGGEVVAAALAENMKTWTWLGNEEPSAHEDPAELRSIRAELERLQSQQAASESARRMAELQARDDAARDAAHRDGLIGLGIAVLGGAFLSKR